MSVSKILKIIIFIVVIAGVGFLAYNFGLTVGEEKVLKVPPSAISNSNSGETQVVDFSLFWETWRKLENNFLEKDKLDYQKMVYGAIEGMVSSLGDPYTTFFTPTETKDFKEELSGKYEGVGMVVGIKDDQLTVISPFKDTPADKAGLKPGDRILKVGDKLSQDITIEEAVSLIKGPRGTSITLLIQRNGWKEAKSFEVKRQVITIPTLELNISEDGIATIKIYQFNDILSKEFKQAALKILNSKADKIILDLRNNPGGFLHRAQEVAGYFLKRNKVVTWEDTGDPDNRKAYRSNGPSTFLEYPTVVLINKGSASASEILAGALRDQRGVKLIGEKSFGKGSVQEQLDLSDGSSLKVTIAKWLTPNGTSINKNGLLPDIEVKSEEGSDVDAQLNKAIEFLKSSE